LSRPAALSIVMNTFGEGAERNKALGIWGGIGASAATAGLLAGGLLVRYAGWEYIFVLNVPGGDRSGLEEAGWRRRSPRSPWRDRLRCSLPGFRPSSSWRPG
jgi:MFS family permease